MITYDRHRNNPVYAVLRKLWTGQIAPKECGHLDQIQDVEPGSKVCDECVELGDTWPDLRMCMICGYVGCCDKAKNTHAKRHFEETGHPVFQPIKLLKWYWCYVDQALI